MDINSLTFGEALEIAALVKGTNEADSAHKSLDGFAIGKSVIIRTYSAGVWCGMLAEKAGNEVILKNARRMWQWWCKKSISLSAVVQYGINQDRSRIAPPVDEVWMEAIEILPIEGDALESIMEAPIVQAE